MDKMEKLEQELAVERTDLAHERTGLSILRTELALKNSRLSVEQTHLSFVRTQVSLVGSAAAVYTALPALGVSGAFSKALALFLLVWAIYFFIRDRMTYPKQKREISNMEKMMEDIIKKPDPDR